jgi:hypothetical protein
MPNFRPTPDCDILYLDDGFTDPWTQREPASAAALAFIARGRG